RPPDPRPLPPLPTRRSSDLFRELRPVAPHRLHAREDQALSVRGRDEARVALAGPGRVVPHRGKAQPQIEPVEDEVEAALGAPALDRKSTRLNSSHRTNSYAV